MKTAFKSEIKDFKVLGVTSKSVDDTNGKTPCISLSFEAKAKGRLVEWNNITGNALVSLARVSASSFGPGEFSIKDFSWVVHIMRNGQPVVRGMKPTPRKDAINRALVQLLAPALVTSLGNLDAGPEKEKPAPKAEPKAEPESGDDLLEIPPFLKRDPGEKQPAAA